MQISLALSFTASWSTINDYQWPMCTCKLCKCLLCGERRTKWRSGGISTKCILRKLFLRNKVTKLSMFALSYLLCTFCGTNCSQIIQWTLIMFSHDKNVTERKRSRLQFSWFIQSHCKIFTVMDVDCLTKLTQVRSMVEISRESHWGRTDSGTEGRMEVRDGRAAPLRTEQPTQPWCDEMPRTQKFQFAIVANGKKQWMIQNLFL